MNSNLYPDDILHYIVRLSKMLNKNFDSNLEESGLTSVQGRSLLYIWRNKNIGVTLTQKELGDFFGLSKSTTSELIHRMKSKDLIHTEIENKKVYLLLTEKGLSLIDVILKGREETVKRLESSLKPEEAQLIKNYLKTLITNVKGEE